MNRQVAQRAHQLFRENPNIARMFIFFEAVKGVPSYEAYMNTCRMFEKKLHVKNVEFLFHCNPPKVDLHFMIPGVLEEIKMFLKNPTREEILKIVESEQCQAAKMVYIESNTCTSYFPLRALYNCPRFTLQLGGRPADSVKAAFLKTLMNTGKVQKCVVYGRRKIMNYLNKPEAMVPDFPSFRRYPIKRTNDFYELEYREGFVSLERTQ